MKHTVLAVCIALVFMTSAFASGDKRTPPSHIDINSHNTRTVDRSNTTDVTTGDVTVTQGDLTSTVTQGDLTSTVNIDMVDPNSLAISENALAAAQASTNITTKSDIRLENTPDSVQIVPGSGDTCKAHIGANIAIPGLGTGITIPLPGKECRKLKYYDRMILERQWQAAEIIFCSLKEIRAEFKSLDLNCRDTLTIHIVPLPVTGMISIPEAQYESLMFAQVSKEEYQEQQEQVEYKQAQQQHLIESLEEDHVTDGLEIKALKKKVDTALKERDKRQAVEDKKSESFAELYSKYEQREEPTTEELEDE